MLVATATTVYRIDTAWPGASPTEIFRGKGVRWVAEGESLDLVVLGDATVEVVHGGSSRRIETGIAEPIELAFEKVGALAGDER